ncbi:MAG: DUF1697 domain-containing protein [Acidimicrobiales bacterium]|nr:DUF1697 domain-containing protein [Acidimicrobiales bacterium]
MSKVALFLRAINLGSHNKLNMEELKTCLENAGLGAATTYLQSGNIVLDTDKDISKIAVLVNEAIKQDFGKDIMVFTRSSLQLNKIIKSNPFKIHESDPSRLFVVFVKPKFDAKLLHTLTDNLPIGEKLEYLNDAIYFYTPHGAGQSKLAPKLSGPKIGGSARNWNTVTKVAQMLGPK